MTGTGKISAIVSSLVLCLGLVIPVFMVSSCSDRDKSKGPESARIRVITSLYPVYDFARVVGGKRADVSLLLPPGEEPHSFDPRPADILNLNRADIFMYTNVYMEPWINDIVKGLDSKKVTLLDTSKGIVFMEGKAEEHHHEGAAHHEEGNAGETDPHVWLDFDNAAKMVENIRDAFIQKDPENRDYYQKNADRYIASLNKLDRKFRDRLAHCKHKTFINGGHFAFGYLARKYGITYLSAYGVSPDAEPAPGQIVKITVMLKKHHLRYIFHEELLMPRVAQTIANETGAELLFLHGAHNINREDFEKGTSFLSLMEQNLINLEKGLECSRKSSK
jgi:zinc transport system substrate-binding protein